MALKYVAAETTKLRFDDNGKATTIELLWGDRVDVISSSGAESRVRARGKTGRVKKADLGDESLLEIYFIDVGQGDGVLIRTPDDRHVMIDGGYRRGLQPTGKNAADFVDWKFFHDYGRSAIELDAMIASHCDADHYGGLWDLLNPAETDELDIKTVRVGAFHHAGVGWWKNGSDRWLGPVSPDGYLTQLMGARAAVGKALSGAGGSPQLQGEWAQFMTVVYDSGCPIGRLSQRDTYVPGFAPSDGAASLRVLAPVEFTVGGKPAVRALGRNPAQNTNGHSVLLRLDYGRTRTLLTGDLNAASQKVLLEQYAGQRLEFACDVAKACHHGSDDCSYEFLSTLGASATVISSGDLEGHAHPRPGIVAASALTGHVRVERDRVVTPLVYSTEIARGVRLGAPQQATVPGAAAPVAAADVRVEYREQKVGDLKPRTFTRPLGDMLVVPGIVYGLVNVRTDGQKIVCATLNEKSHTWDLQSFESRF